MKKTTKKTVKVPKVGPVVEVKKYGIDLLGGDFGREDLNIMRDKINEIIKKLDDHG